MNPLGILMVKATAVRATMVKAAAVRILVVRVIVVCALMVGVVILSPTGSSAQAVVDSGDVFEIDLHIPFVTEVQLSKDGPIRDRKTVSASHTLRTHGNAGGYIRWKTLYNMHGSVGVTVNGVDSWLLVDLRIDWQNAILEAFDLTGPAPSATDERSKVSIRIRDLQVTTTDTSFVLDVPIALFNTSEVSASYHRIPIWLTSKDSFIHEESTRIDSAQARLKLRATKPRFLAVQPFATIQEDFRVVTHLHERTAHFTFTPSVQERTLSVYNSLGVCIKEMTVHPSERAKRLSFTSLPTGHYTARLGNTSRSFMVWR